LNAENRKQLCVEEKIQKGIVTRFVMYISFSFLFITLPVSFVQAWLDPSRYWHTHFINVWVDYLPLLICLTLFVPFAIVDLLRYTNRIVGPIFRLKSELKKMEDGKSVQEELNFRANDFWHELADDFNQLAEQVHQLRQENKELSAELAKK